VKVRVKAQPCSHTQRILQNEDGSLKIYLKSSPAKGKANKELREIIAKHYGVSKARVKIITGCTSRNKIIELIKE